MILAVQPESPPLRVDESGAVRVGNTRVSLELVIWAFEEGSTPESIVQQYPTLSLADVYAVIGYYLHHRAEMAEYLAQCEREAQEVEKLVESRQRDMSAIRARILAHRKA